jgi:hypothetical protein
VGDSNGAVNKAHLISVAPAAFALVPYQYILLAKLLDAI